ncbi:MAG: DUF4855 domain-containing protein, partial [Muribaculaceae bacterium]|nr:DUF4855 domain-containing protein [Muribaculaceae bacterium]
MNKALSLLLMLLCISCSSNTPVTKTAVTQTSVSQTGNNSVVNDLHGVDKVSYTTYAEYVGKAGEANTNNLNTETSNTGASSYTYIETSNPGEANSDNYSTSYSNSYSSPIDDMILIYYGNKNRLKCGKTQLTNIVMHTFSDGHKDWLFPSFLYLEIKSDRGVKLGDNQLGDNGPAKKEDWEWLINRYFSTAYNGGEYEGLKALDECIENCKRILGLPAFRHKVVLGIPSPCTDFTEWGNIKMNGKTIKLDFRNKNHRQESVKWFINELIKRFEAQHFKNITLEGFYWIEESTSMTSWHIDESTRKWTNQRNNRHVYVIDNKTRRYNDIIADISKYVHSRGFKFIWIPFNGAYGNDKWKTFGFDRCDIQTGYFWDTPDLLRKPRTLKTISDLRKICDAAFKDDKGLEFELSDDLFVPCYAKSKRSPDIESPFEIVQVKGCNKTSREMKALGYTQYNYNPCLLARLENLISIFEEQEVFARSNISYYANSSILKLCNSTDRDIIRIA